MAPAGKPLVLLFLVLVGFIGIVTALQLELQAREKRQVNLRPQVSQDDTEASAGVGAQTSAQASSSLLNPSLKVSGTASVQPPVNRPITAGRPKKPKRPATAAAVEADVDSEAPVDEEEQPIRVKPKRKKPARRRPAHDEEEDEEAEEDAEADYDCHDDDDYESFHEAAFRPMRHINRMMNGMFSKMRGLAEGDFHNLPGGGGNMAVASSTSNGDGYSRVSSVVNNNGRTRGVVSETRNGRTKTRRIGSDDDEE